uniref:YibE/F family protein n=2 Tax=Clostridia TaxID=186801 RepID=UPI003FF14469
MRKIIDTFGKYLVVALIMIAMFLFYTSVERKPLLAKDNTKFVKAVVIQNDNEDLQAAADLESGDSQEVVLRIKSGSHKGEEVKAYSLNGYLYGANCKVGTRVIANISEYNGNLSANVYNYDREPEIIALLAAFFGLMWLVGGKKGFNSVLALIFTFAVVVMMYIPMMYIG